MCILARSYWLQHAVTLTTDPSEALEKTVLLCALTSPSQNKILSYPVITNNRSHSVPSGVGRFYVYFCALLVFRPLIEREGGDVSQNSKRTVCTILSSLETFLPSFQPPLDGDPLTHSASPLQSPQGYQIAFLGGDAKD